MIHSRQWNDEDHMVTACEPIHAPVAWTVTSMVEDVTCPKCKIVLEVARLENDDMNFLRFIRDLSRDELALLESSVVWEQLTAHFRRCLKDAVIEVHNEKFPQYHV